MEKKKEAEKAIDYLKKVIKKKEHQEKKDPKDSKIKELEDKNNELTDTLQHLQAEFENYKKRVLKDNEHLMKFASARLIEKLLPIIDSLELALKNSTSKEHFVKGVELIYSQLFSTLESEGLRPIKALGEKFDPYKHEVLLKEPSDNEEDIIVEELQKGYMLNDRMLRHSKVKVSAGKPTKERECK